MVRYEPTGRTDSTWETHFYSAILNLATNDSVRLYGNMHSQSSANPYHMGGSGSWGHFTRIFNRLKHGIYRTDTNRRH